MSGVIPAERRVRFRAEYGNSPLYNASGEVERYNVDVPYQTVTDFQRLWYYSGQTWGNLTWMGVAIQKYPTDLLIYQEILFELQPSLVIECGTFAGGSALYLAQLFDLIAQRSRSAGRVVTIDVERQEKYPEHPRITYVTGSSVDPEVVTSMHALAEGQQVLVILDSSHVKDHVLAELNAYHDLATYLIVEDTNINGHPVRPDFGPGPYEAVEEFLPSHPEFERDRIRERMLLTANPGGYLRRI